MNLRGVQYQAIIPVGEKHRVRTVLMLVIAAVLLGSCAAKQKAVSAQAVSAQEDQPLVTDGSKMARESSPGLLASEDYERAVANYNDCILEHTANLSACEDQRAIMNADGRVLPKSSLSERKKSIKVVHPAQTNAAS